MENAVAQPKKRGPKPKYGKNKKKIQMTLSEEVVNRLDAIAQDLKLDGRSELVELLGRSENLASLPLSLGEFSPN